ncbi:MAG: 7TM-DISM domain-containing protein, partial [Limnobacter sp.]
MIVQLVPFRLKSLPCPQIGLIAVLLFSLLVSLNCPPARAQEGLSQGAPRLELSSFVPSPIDVSENLRWLVDPTHDLTLDEIASFPDDAFVKDKEIASFGYSRDVIWYRLDITVHDKLTTHPLVEINPTYLNFIDVALFTGEAIVPIWQAHLGDHVPASKRPFAGTTHVTDLPPLDAGEYRMFIRVQSKSTNFIRVKFWPPTDLITSLTFRNVAT